MTASFVKQHYQDESVARSYDRARFTDLPGRVFDRLEKRALRKAVRKVVALAPGPRVLDVPCGTGRITALLLADGLDVTAGDISQAMLDVARTKCAGFGHRVAFRQLDLDALELPGASFDLVTCIRLFHHLDTHERERILRELARVSRRFVLVNVSYSSPYYRLRRRVKRRLGQGVSATSSTWAEIQREASTAGLKIHAADFVLRFATEDLVLTMEKI